jgi:hypothetical protein
MGKQSYYETFLSNFSYKSLRATLPRGREQFVLGWAIFSDGEHEV